ncbi:YDR352W [Saccharomyces arboricola H-6]|uniref:YDR352W n=1 Tax=Saccharomyces arboricola (strain H-6 / AS 2.3317 / CBS 10644) TaxID=1160507 RepID=J8Q3Q8_SACAR|nr:YDR352W [Saccharomyces arboricola H-6]
MSCSNSIWPTISNLSGSLSFFASVVSLFPQIIETYRDKTVDGLSPYFLLAWLCGDITSLIGARLTGQLLFQILLAIYFLLNDSFVCGQYYYYGVVHQNKLATIGHEPKPLLPELAENGELLREEEDIIRGSSAGSHRSSRRRSAIMAALAITQTISAATASPISVTSQAGPPGDSFPDHSKISQLGTILSWMGAFFYVGARIPQLIKNYNRKSTDGLSPFLFATTLLCNITYNMSIFTSCQFLTSQNKREFVINELPFIFGSAGTIAFDLIYFYQYYVLYATDMQLRELEREIYSPEEDSVGQQVTEHTSLLSGETQT